MHAGIDNHKVPDCLELIFQQLSRTKKNYLTQDEFKRAKEFYLGQLSLALEDTMEYMLWMGESVSCLDKVYSLEQIIKEVNMVSLEQVKEVASQIFAQKIINLALIGPLAKSEKQIRSRLNLG